MNLSDIKHERPSFANASYALILLTLLCLLSGCQGSIASQVIANSYPTELRNYKTAGFNSTDEINGYAKHSQYLAFKISSEDWRSFYSRFPEYWIDIQNSKSYTFMNDYNQGYTAYAFRWNMMNKKKSWDDATIERLTQKKLLGGDDTYKIVFAMGPPERIIWDNDFEILIYNNDSALLLKDSKYASMSECKGCVKKMDTTEKINKSLDINQEYFTKSNDEVLSDLKLTRPAY